MFHPLSHYKATISNYFPNYPRKKYPIRNKGVVTLASNSLSIATSENFIHLPSFIINKNKTILQWNQPCEITFGFTSEEVQSGEQVFNQLFSNIEDYYVQEILFEKRTIRIEDIQLVSKSDTLIDVSLIASPYEFQGEHATRVLCVVRDQSRTLNNSIQSLTDFKNGIYSSFMTVNLDNEGFITGTNALFLKASQWTPKRVIGKTFWNLFPDTEENSKVTNAIWKTLVNGNIWQGEVEKIAKNGESYWVYLTAIPTISQSKNSTEYVLVEQDITKDKIIQLQLEKIAYIDTETGLMNIHRLEQVINESIIEDKHFSFVYLSIDNYYTIKDLHENQTDNTLITEFTKRLKMYFQDSSMARVNENDFVIITPLPEWYIQGFLNYLLQNPIYNGNIAVPISISGGITRYPEDQSTFAELMKASIATITHVREAGGNSVVSLSLSTHKALNRKSLVEKRLLLALDQEHLNVLFQPQLDLRSGKITTVEALVRWEDAEIGVVSPDELIPIAEETGLINNIGSFMLEKVCEQALAWQRAGIELKISINSSVREFRDKNMAKSILETLNRTGCPAHLIQIEITEKFALEAEAETGIIKQMRQLENEGITFALDDFGTGYASFRYIQLLPIQILKIDQTFTHSLIQSEKQQRLIHGMIQLGKSMNLTVLAEGVETEEEQNLLTTYGCDALQGYFISKPVTASEITALLRRLN